MRVARKNLKRKPLGRREAVIIKRMHTMAKLPVTITKVVQRHKKSVDDVLSNKASFAKRGACERRKRGVEVSLYDNYTTTIRQLYDNLYDKYTTTANSQRIQ